MALLHKEKALWDKIDPIIVDTLWDYNIELVKSMPQNKRDFLLMQISDLIYQNNLMGENIQYRDMLQDSTRDVPLDELLYHRVLKITRKVFDYYN